MRDPLPHVLVVDDDASIREALGAALGRAYAVHAAATGDEACAVLQRHPVAAIILDVVLGREQGLGLVELRCLRPRGTESNRHILPELPRAEPIAEGAPAAVPHAPGADTRSDARCPRPSLAHPAGRGNRGLCRPLHPPPARPLKNRFRA